MKLIRYKDLENLGIVNNWTTLMRWIKKGDFPQGIKIGPNSRAWSEEDIDAWVKSRTDI